VQTNGVAVFSQILQVTGFELNGQPVNAAGFGRGYGLYFNINGITTMNGGPPVYSVLNASLVADPGNNDGTVSATVGGGLAFSNGTAGDFALGSGTLISASLGLDGSGTRHAHYLDSFQSQAGEAAFFGNLAPPLMDVVLTTPGTAFAAILQPDGTTINLVNGGTGQVTFGAPEPASMLLVGGGLLAVFLVGRRTRI
jgi:hypothetical protein